ncbi:hypothetical protein DFQ28_004460 [Apophysomyces sp. BC1034]|nr:hypothetical protein DFQ28_004460 [Apophysomyces sp. BC1034]
MTDPFVIPTIDWNAIGQLGFTGDFAGLSRFNSTAQFESIEPDVSSIILQENGLYELVASTNGRISATCLLDSVYLFIGGNFSTIHNTSYNNVARYNLQTRTLSPLAQGLDGPVHTLYCDTDNVYAGGEFGKPSTNAAMWKADSWVPVPWKGFNGPVYTIKHNPKTDTLLFGGRFDATMDGQFLNTNTSQTVNIGAPTVVSSGNNALNANYSNPHNIICPNSTPQSPGNPWLLENGVPGYWEAQFGHTVQPTVFRIANTHYEGRGTRTFSIVALGSNHYFDLSYVDPSTQQTIQCSGSCVLSNSTTIAYQDFTVLHPISTNALRIYIDSWYGAGGGLSSVEIFQSEAVVLPSVGNANATQQCSDNPTSSTTVVGTWTEKYAYGYYQNVLTTSFPSSQLPTANVSVTYKPYIPAQGQYKVYTHTAGCVGSSTCGQRTQVEMIISLFPGVNSTVIIDQTNAQDKMTLIYQGLIAPTSAGFEPSVTLRIPSNATIPSSGNTVSVIADAMQFIRNGTSPPLVSILEYSPRNATVNGTSAWRPLSQQLIPGSTVTTLDASSGDVLYIGGQFGGQNATYQNIVSYDYRIGGGQMVPLAQGVDGSVEHIVLSNDKTSVLFSGQFTHRSGHLSSGNANWSLSTSRWVDPSSLVVGSISSVYSPDARSDWMTGDIRSAQTYRGNVVTLSNKVAYSHVIDSDNVIVNAGVFWNNTVIVGGKFTAGNVSNLVVAENGGWNPIQQFNGEIRALAVHEDRLYIGGKFTGLSPTDGAVNSFAVYDLKQRANVAVPGIYAADGSLGTVNTVEIDPDSQTVYIGGDFANAGSLNCVSVCALQPNTLQWNVVANGLAGRVNEMSAFSGQINVAGTLQVNGQSASVARFSPQASSWTTVNNMDIGVPTALLQGQDQQVYMAGKRNDSTFLGVWDGDSFTDLVKLGPTSDIHQLLYVPISSAPHDARFPAGSQMMLMVAGHLYLDNFGNVSAAMFDGENWYPFVLTSTGLGQPGVVHRMLHPSTCCTVRNIELGVGVIGVALKHRHSSDVPEPMPPWSPKSPPFPPPLPLLDNTLAVAGPSNSAAIPPAGFGALMAAAAATAGAAATAATAGAAATAGGAGPSEEKPRLMYGKYPFEAKELGELGFNTGDPIVVTDTSDKIWWIGAIDDAAAATISFSRLIRSRSLWTSVTGTGHSLRACVDACVDKSLRPNPSVCVALVSKSFSAADYESLPDALGQALNPQLLVGAVVDRVPSSSSSSGHGLSLWMGYDEDVVGFGVQDTQTRQKVRSISVGRWGRVDQPNYVDEVGWEGFGSVSQPAQRYILPPALKKRTGTSRPSFVFTVSDNEPDELLHALDHHYPETHKIGLIGASTPFVNGNPYTLFYKNQMMSAGMAGFAVYGNTLSSLDLDHAQLQPLGKPMTITRCRGNIILDLDEAGATGLLLELIRQGKSAQISKDEEFYLGVYPSGQIELDNTTMSINRVTSGDPSRGNMSVDTTEDLKVGQVVQFMRRAKRAMAWNDVLKGPKDSIVLAVTDRDDTIDASPLQLPSEATSDTGIFGATTENGILLGKANLASQIVDVPYSKAIFKAKK